MRIRITGVGEKSAHSWYARCVGNVYEVVEYKSGKPGHYTIVRFEKPSPQYAFVVETDAKIIKEYEPMKSKLHQFFPNSNHDNSDTLQMIMSQRAWLEFISTIIGQIKDNISDDELLTLEITGQMISIESEE